MNEVKIKILKLDHFDEGFELPAYKTKGAAGADVKASLPSDIRESGITLAPFERKLIPTGLAMEIPEGFEVQVRPRSGLSLKTNLMIVNGPGTIDCDYRGEVNIIVGNIGNESLTINHGDRVAQLIVSPVTQVKYLVEGELSETERGAGGFGSTGVS